MKREISPKEKKWLEEKAKMRHEIWHLEHRIKELESALREKDNVISKLQEEKQNCENELREYMNFMRKQLDSGLTDEQIKRHFELQHELNNSVWSLQTILRMFPNLKI